MARLQVLYLPTDADGTTRFGLVADQAGELADSDRDALRAFASELGAQGAVVLSGAVDLAQGDGDDSEADAEMAAHLGEALAALASPAQPQPPKLPPPDTTEGKYARILGGQKILDQMKEADPHD